MGFSPVLNSLTLQYKPLLKSNVRALSSILIVDEQLQDCFKLLKRSHYSPRHLSVQHYELPSLFQDHVNHATALNLLSSSTWFCSKAWFPSKL